MTTDAGQQMANTEQGRNTLGGIMSDSEYSYHMYYAGREWVLSENLVRSIKGKENKVRRPFHWVLKFPPG